MALLIYVNGMDVRVSTIRDNEDLYTAGYGNEYFSVTWDYCGEDASYRGRCQELQRDNDHLQQVANDMVADKLKWENEAMRLKKLSDLQRAEIDRLEKDSAAMHEKITRAYKVLT